MKQNERLLVYAVTGFLALILVVAVVFGDAPRAVTGSQPAARSSLGDILSGGGAPEAGPAGGAGAATTTVAPTGAAPTGGVPGGAGPTGARTTGLNTPVAVKVEQPLRAPAPTPAAIVKQKVGPYRRDHGVRFVTAKRGDSFSHLAKRWCGKVEGYVEEIGYLNETTTVLKEGQTVGVPWVDDEVLVAILEAEEVPTLLKPEASGSLQATLEGAPRPARSSGPGYAVPEVARSAVAPDAGEVAGPAAPAAPAFETYKVQPDDSLWKILAKKFGNGKVPKLLGPVREMNPDVNFDNLQIGVTIKLPTSAE